jgi:hypothetical protein
VRGRDEVGEAKSIGKVFERRGVDGDLDTDARRMTTLLEGIFDGFFFFLPME